MERLVNALGVLRRQGLKGAKTAIRVFYKNSAPYFSTPKYRLIESAMKKVKKVEGADGVGDYMEFGLYRGRAFLSACELSKDLGLEMHLYGFDSFEGLPVFDKESEESKVFYSGQYACSQEEFRKIMNSWRVSPERYTLIPGFFDQSLSSDYVDNLPLKKCSIAFIDCDLYESTVPVLEFLGQYLSNGSILIFDDWFSFAGNPNAGQIRAVREWLEKNKNFSLLEFERIGNRVSFFVQDWNS